MTQPKVLVGIVSMKSTALVRDCLACLARSSYPRFDVMLVENGGPDAFLELTAMLDESCGPPLAATADGPSRLQERAMGSVRVLACDAGANLGYAGGVNVVIRQREITDWDALWVLNPDTFPEPEALAALVRKQREGGYGIVGSLLLFTASGLVQTWGGIGWRRWLGRGKLIGFRSRPDVRPDDAEVEAATAFVSGASMYVMRDYVETVGGMDEDFFAYCEDTEWCLRGADRYRFGYAHDSVVHHVHGGVSGSSLSRGKRSRFNVYLNERNKVMLARKREGVAAPLFWLISLAQTCEYLFIGRSWRNFAVAVDGWGHGVAGETGAPHWMRNREPPNG